MLDLFRRIATCLVAPPQDSAESVLSPELGALARPPLRPLPSPPLPPPASFLPPPASFLLSLPAEVVRHLVATLDSADIASLLSVTTQAQELSSALDDLFADCLLTQATKLERSLASRHLSTISDEDRQLMELLPELCSRARCGGARRSCNELKQLTCAICESRGTSGHYFSLTRRGVCAVCIIERKGPTQRWIHRQATREQACRKLHDEAARNALFAAVRDALPAELSGGEGGSHASGGRRGGGGERTAASGSELLARAQNLELLFDAERQGGSCVALVRAAERSSAAAFLVLVHERAPEQSAPEQSAPDGAATQQRGLPRAFGGFVASRWQRTSGFFGSDACFLFRLPPKQTAAAATAATPASSAAAATATSAATSAASSAATSATSSSTTAAAAAASTTLLLRPTRLCSNFVHSSPERGLGFGGDLGRFGLSLEPDLTRGQCLHTLTFGDASGLATAATFLCANVQLWGVHASHEPSSRLKPAGARAPWEDEPEGVLKPGEDRLMLEFIGIEKIQSAILREAASR